MLIIDYNHKDPHMIFREATIKDINQIQHVRNAVVENALSDPAIVTDEDCESFLTIRGKGWVCEIEERIVGFAIVDISEDNIWALFLKPEFEGRGIGKILQKIMLDWYFSIGKQSVWLGTAPNTRAEVFYTNTGWIRNGMHGEKEVRFEMTKERWRKLS